MNEPPQQPQLPYTGQPYDPRWGTQPQPNQYQPSQPSSRQQPSSLSKSVRIPLWGLLILIVGALVVGGGLAKAFMSGAAMNNGGVSVTSKPAPQGPTWKTLDTFTHRGDYRTPVFAVPSDWKIIVNQCPLNAPAPYGGDYSVLVYPYAWNGNLLGGPMGVDNCQTTVSPGVSGSSEEYQSGHFYLAVEAQASWSITIEGLE